MNVPLADIPPLLDRRPVVGSSSLFKTFENCPFQGNARYIARNLPFVETDEMRRGNEVHKAFEYRIADGKPLPTDMAQWEPLAAPLDRFADDGNDVWKGVEVKLGVTQEGKSCDFFAKDVFCRGKIDVVVARGDSAYLPDWKTGGSRYEDSFELRVNAVLIQARLPRLKHIKGQYVWLKENRLGQMYDLSDTAATWREIVQRHETIMNQRRLDEFPKRQSGLCGWCSVKWCQHNPQYERTTT